MPVTKSTLHTPSGLRHEHTRAGPIEPDQEARAERNTGACLPVHCDVSVDDEATAVNQRVVDERRRWSEGAAELSDGANLFRAFEQQVLRPWPDARSGAGPKPSSQFGP